MIRFLSFLCIVASFWAQGSSLQAQAKTIDEIVAKVGDEVILLSEVEQQLAYLKEQQQGKALPENIECMILENQISQNLLLSQARRDSLEVTDEEVNAQIKSRMEDILRMMGGDPAQFKQYYGKTVEEQTVELFDVMKNKILTDKMQDKIISGTTVTPDEVHQFFQRIPKDSLPYFNAEVEVSQIIYKPKVNASERQKAKDLAEQIRKRLIEGGEKFEELAKKYSNDLGSAQNGGDLGWQKRGTFVPEFEASAYNLESMQISEPVETEFGFHVIQQLERRGNLIHCRHILIQPDITMDDLKIAQKVMDSIRTAILDGKVSFGDMVRKYSDKSDPSYHNSGRMLNPKTGNTFFETKDIDYQIFFAIDSMKVGGITSPIKLKSQAGLEYFTIIQLNSRSKAHQASMATDYSRITDACIADKKARIMAEWVADHVRGIYVWHSNRYTGCENLEPYLNTRQE